MEPFVVVVELGENNFKTYVAQAETARSAIEAIAGTFTLSELYQTAPTFFVKSLASFDSFSLATEFVKVTHSEIKNKIKNN